MPGMTIRLAVRAVIVEEGRLLLVNAYPGEESALWCAPGGGVEKHSSLADNLVREVYEETGLTVEVGAPCLVNEFHSEASGFHQVDMFFRCRVREGALSHSIFSRISSSSASMCSSSPPEYILAGFFPAIQLQEGK